MTVDYISQVDRVAQGLATSHDFNTLWANLQNAWNSFETMAEVDKYDILDVRFTHQIKMQRIAQLLYHFPKASWQADASTLRVKDRDYGGSWCRRGGCGAFMMLARKWDRIENQVRNSGSLQKALEDADVDDGIMDDIQDLRCYLILCLSWIAAKSIEF